MVLGFTLAFWVQGLGCGGLGVRVGKHLKETVLLVGNSAGLKHQGSRVVCCKGLFRDVVVELLVLGKYGVWVRRASLRVYVGTTIRIHSLIPCKPPVARWWQLVGSFARMERRTQISSGSGFWVEGSGFKV